jgi:hypothetical protein
LQGFALGSLSSRKILETEKAIFSTFAWLQFYGKEKLL